MAANPAEAAWLITAYCASLVCGALDHGITQSGKPAIVGKTIACPKPMQHGTVIQIESVVGTRTCEDRGEAITGEHLDLLVTDQKTAIAFGRKQLKIKILWRPGDLPPWDPKHSE